MPDSPDKTAAFLLPRRPDTKALNKLLNNMASSMIKSPPKKQLKSKSLNSPTARKFESSPLQPTLSGWLSKPKVRLLSSTIQPTMGHRNNRKYKTAEESSKPLKLTTTRVEAGATASISKESVTIKRTSKKASTPTLKRFNSASSDELPTFKEVMSRKRLKQADTFNSSKSLKLMTPTKVEQGVSSSSSKQSVETKKMSKKASKPTLKRFNSASSDELPTFKEKTSRKRSKETDTFKKYGVIVPSLDEIMEDQKQFASYKSQVEAAQTLKEPSFKMPLTPQKLNQLEGDQLLLDCKQLTLEEISDYFNDNICFLQDIIKGKQFSDRHRRYFGKRHKIDDLTTRDLTYNTSTIVFTFEQIDHMISLMQPEFDPEDKKTDYFFKVLVPEFCLKIFMETHDMNKKEANAYLENRPVD